MGVNVLIQGFKNCVEKITMNQKERQMKKSQEAIESIREKLKVLDGKELSDFDIQELYDADDILESVVQDYQDI